MSEKRPDVMEVGRVLLLRGPQMLALQRAKPPFPWEAPGGKVEAGQSLIETLEREVEEETGFRIQPISGIVHREQGILRGGRYDGVLRITHFVIAHVVSGRVRLSEEHLDHEWCRHRAFQNLPLTEETRNAEQALQHDLRKAGLR